MGLLLSNFHRLSIVSIQHRLYCWCRSRQGGRRVRKKDVYTELGRLLADPNACDKFTTDQLEQVLNLVLVDHSITDCLLTLSHRNTNKNAENMMRRLSSFKSAPKSLVENISFDPEFYGYENGGCSAFTEDHEEDEEIDTVDNVVLPYAAPPTLTTKATPSPTSLNTAMSVGNSDCEMNDSDEGEHSSSDSDCDSPTQMKKGLRRFFCLPAKSMKAMKSLKLPTKKAPRKAGLLDED